MESRRIAAQRIAVFLKRGFFSLLHRGKLCPLAVDHNGYRLCAVRLSSFLRVRLEHSAVLRLLCGLLAVHCCTQQGNDLLISGKMAEVVDHAAVAVTDVLTLGVRSAVRQQ